MGKFISNLFLGALAIGLSIFTASRTLDLLGWALPAGQTIYQWLGLAAFEGGMYFWSFYFVNGAKGTPQRSISVCMAVFSIVAVCVATIADLSLGASESGKIAPLTPAMQQAMIVFLGIVIALNVAAFLACKLLSIENLRAIKEGQAEDSIYDAGLHAIAALAPSLASEAAPHLAAEWSNRTWERIVPGVQRRTEYVGPAPAVPALPAGSSAPVPATLPQTASIDTEVCHQCGKRVPDEAGRWHQFVAGGRAFFCLNCVPRGAAAPEPKAGLLARAKGFLGRGGKREFQPDPVMAAQNRVGMATSAANQAIADIERAGEEAKAKLDEARNPVKPSEKTSNQVYREEMRARRASSNVSAVAAARRARRAQRLARPVVTVTEETPAPAPESAPAPEQAPTKKAARTKK